MVNISGLILGWLYGQPITDRRSEHVTIKAGSETQAKTGE